MNIVKVQPSNRPGDFVLLAQDRATFDLLGFSSNGMTPGGSIYHYSVLVDGLESNYDTIEQLKEAYNNALADRKADACDRIDRAAGDARVRIHSVGDLLNIEHDVAYRDAVDYTARGYAAPIPDSLVFPWAPPASIAKQIIDERHAAEQKLIDIRRIRVEAKHNIRNLATCSFADVNRIVTTAEQALSQV